MSTARRVTTDSDEVVTAPLTERDWDAKVGGAELSHGVATTFGRAGFVDGGRTGATRPVMRIAL